MALGINQFINNFRFNINIYLIMENTSLKVIGKFAKLLEYISEERIEKLYEALEKTFPDEYFKQKNPEVQIKTGWAIGTEEDKGNHCSIFLKTNNEEGEKE